MYLSQIDPEASCAAEAQALSKQISQTTQKQWEFENVTKYKDAVALEKHRKSDIADCEYYQNDCRGNPDFLFHFLFPFLLS